jgi:gliding motility-associated lipoprotein GldD
MVNDAFTMVGKHNIKAQYRDDFPIQKSNNVSGMLFELKGDVASNLQFYLTDSVNHFFRASLYFNSKVYPDSIAPILEFVKQDVLHVIETFDWQRTNP